MKFLSRSLSQKLTAIGLKSESGFYSYPNGYLSREPKELNLNTGDIEQGLSAFIECDLIGLSNQARENRMILFGYDKIWPDNPLSEHRVKHHTMIDLKEDQLEPFLEKILQERKS